MTAPSPRHCRLILLAAALLVMGRLVLCDFVWWDDEHTVMQNPHLNPAVTLETFSYHWTHASASIYVPLTYTVWALLAPIARVPPDPIGVTLNPMFFHGVNVLIHACGALAAFALLRRLVKSDLAALLGALLWAVHPVQVESVAWVSGLKDVLSGTLVLAALAAFVHFRKSGRQLWYAVALAAYVSAMLAKPSAFTMPLMVLAIDRLLLRTPWKNVLIALMPMLLVTLPIAAIARHVQPSPVNVQPPWVRGLLFGDTIAFYVGEIVAPIHLTFDYGRDVATLRQTHELFVGWLLPAAIAIGVGIVYARRRSTSPLPAGALLLFVLAPLHVLGLTQFDFQTISTTADHYLYVAMIGPALLLAWAVARWPKLTIYAVVVVAALGLRAAWQTRVWQDSESLFGHCLLLNPRSWTSYSNLDVLAEKRRDFVTADRYLFEAERLAPDQPTVVLNMLIHFSDLGDRDQTYRYADKLIAIYDKSWKPAGFSPAQAHEKVVGVLMDSERYDAAEDYIRGGLERDPNDAILLAYRQAITWKRPATLRS